MSGEVHATGAHRKHANTWGYLMVVFAAFLFAAQSPTTKVLLGMGYSSQDIATILFIMGAVFVDLWIVASRKWEIVREGLRNWKVVFLISVLNFVQSSGYFLTLRYVDASVGIVLMYLSPSFICIFFMISKLRPVSRANKFAVVLSLIGIILAVDLLTGGLGAVAPIGILVGVGVAVIGATTGILIDLKGGDFGAFTLLAFELTVGAVIGAITNPGVFGLFAAMPAFDWGFYTIVTLLTKICSLYLVLRGYISIGAPRTSVIMIAEVPFTLILSFLILHERMSPIQLAGVAMIIIAVIMLQKSPQEEE